ncbi:hypothetical protein [Roseimicrobium sp. ORNL1]|uniref:hypothetical protein n=1 Tax=Roseimicrobium sp. ORNL1 TaxID=2711231 RepID=UPI0013E14EC8|nr:hypothetical protein [Roseimicrobium sp. ORNL1]QIF03938.1 hypothetical protein G5S37_21200 [Roseimicrobium sp. ORNL1]
MCCFSQPVKDVSNTKIFARLGNGVDQFVAYAMNLSADEELSMVLPIPVVPGSGEKAVKFINLEKYPRLFEDLWKGFPAPVSRSRGGDTFGPAAVYGVQKLEVQSVGAFDASFVPTIADFSRLDERFRLPEKVWKKLPGYATFGFAVFKLKDVHGPVHPMAFLFPSSMPQSLFFPTMHIHDGEIHAKEEFDHTLYCQGSNIDASWQESPGIAVQFVKCGLTHDMVSPKHHVHRRLMKGVQENGDVLLRAGKVAA